MAPSRSLFRSSTQFSKPLRSFATSSESAHHNNHQENHKYLEPSSYVGSWVTPKDPKEAEAKLAQLRRNYAKQVKERRKEYIHEVELMRLDKQRKDEAKREAIRVANEERRKLKAEAAKVRAQERKIADEEFRQTLLKERAEKLEYWKMKLQSHEEKKKEKKELLHRQSSTWVDEPELEKKILESIVDTTPL
ncbi:Stress response NST1-like protein [Quillaja saponaria]|uniref:Stress response NST1-like protein n=1 Tax=Quillaja saponaria TaxID=32244 RepID=A0AAD7Q343_QUISA|nr:Stress response NST1-like protein [Quillaja saponaria]